MKTIFALWRRDISHVSRNVIALLICFGLAIMPSLYAWFNIAGGWDPYGNTGQLKVAIASSDAGYKSELLPVSVNVGERVIASMVQSDKVDFVVTNEQDAQEGVRSGAYYASIVLPETFSADLFSALSAKTTHPRLSYFVNEKRNPIASIVTGKVSGSVQTMLDESFAKAITEIAANLLEELSGAMDNDTLLLVANNLSGALGNATSTARRMADDMAAYQAALSSLRAAVDAGSSLMGNSTSSLGASTLLTSTADGVRGADKVVSEAEGLASEALDAGEAAAQSLEEQVDRAFEVAGGQADRVESALNTVSQTIHDKRDTIARLNDSLAGLDGQLDSLARSLEIPGSVATVDINRTREVKSNISDLRDRASRALATLDGLIATYDQLLDDLRASRSDVELTRQELKDLAAQATSEIEAVRTEYENNISGSLGTLADTIESAASDAESVSSSLSGTMNSARPVVANASGDLAKLDESLSKISGKLNETADALDGLRARLTEATESGNISLIRTIVGSDPTGLAEFISAPVEVERTAFFPVENNGSAMTPYYTTMALWVGGTLMGVLMYVGISEKAKRETGARPHHAYFGRLAFFLTIGFFQAAVLLLGDLYFLGVQCENPLLFLLTGWLASTVFINIIYSLATSFGDVGKAIAVLFMVIQVAGSGGTFPVEMLPQPFQVLYPFLPFVHSENAMRAAMFGTYGNDWLMSMGTLALYLVPALLLGLVLRKPLIGFNEWIEEKMEETKLM